MAPLTLYFLQASRAIRIAWILEELKLDYDVQFFYRENNKAPQAFRDAVGPQAHGKSPVLRDGDKVIVESGAIVEYLCTTYGPTPLLPPSSSPSYHTILSLIHAAEGQFMLHALPITWTRWFAAEGTDISSIEDGLKVNIMKDFDWLERILRENGDGKGWLVGDQLTAADITLHFSAQYILTRELGINRRLASEPGRWGNVVAWVDRGEQTESYKRAVKKTGYTLENGGNDPNASK